MSDDQVVWLPSDGSVLGRVIGWHGDVPIIDTSGRLPGPGAIDLAGPPPGSPGRVADARIEAPADDASPRTRGDEPATTPDPAHGAVGVASPSGPAVAVTGGGGAGSVIQGRRRHLF